MTYLQTDFVFRARRHGYNSPSTQRRSCANSRLLFLAEFLETRISAERIEIRIKPQECRRERRFAQAIVGNFQQVLEQGDGAVFFAESREHAGFYLFHGSMIARVVCRQSEGLINPAEGGIALSQSRQSVSAQSNRKRIVGLLL